MNKSIKEAFNTDECAVCLDSFKINIDYVRITIFKYLFDSDCLKLWLKK